jgi:hypothetical protein
MSDNITKEQLEMQMLRMQLAQQSQGGISIAGIIKHWQIILATVAFGGLLWKGGQMATTLETRIATLEKAPVRLETVERRVSAVETAIEQLRGLPATLDVIRQQGETNKRQIEQLLTEIRTASLVQDAERKAREQVKDRK